MFEKIKVGYAHTGYPEFRNIYGNNTTEKFFFEKQKFDIFKVLDHIYYISLNKTNSTLHNFHLAYNRCDLLHFFNGINIGSTSWISTFETFLPRTNSFHLLGIKKLSSKPCKKLIALSKCSSQIQQIFLEENYPSYKESIMNKVTVLHPPQKVIVNSYENKIVQKSMTLTFVGADFFRKGGHEILRAVQYLLDKKYDIKLNIVSSMQFGDYATNSSKTNLEDAMKIIRKFPNNIKHFPSLINEGILELFKESHLGLLPTYADTYGYSVLEAQACGCPVISTNIRALPEINDSSTGYLIELSKDQYGNAVIDNDQGRKKLSERIQQSLIEILERAYTNQTEIAIKGQASISRIKAFHSPENHVSRLEDIYNNALK